MASPIAASAAATVRMNMAKTCPTRSLRNDGERHEIDVDRQQHQLDRHHDDDDVLAVQEDAEHAQGEQDGGHRQVVAETDLEHQMPLPARRPCALRPNRRGPRELRRRCSACARRRRSRSVSRIAPTIATSRIRPASLEQEDVVGVEQPPQRLGVGDRRRRRRRRLDSVGRRRELQPPNTSTSSTSSTSADHRAGRQVLQEALAQLRRS